MIEVSFMNHIPPEGHPTFAVIMAKCQGKWIFCRHRERVTWEIPGGHIESGETGEAAALRELFEEAGATGVTLSRVSGYMVHTDLGDTYGELFFAEVKDFGIIPEGSEIAEARAFEYLPKRCELTYREIQPQLFMAVQGWLNTKSGAGELWDVYDGDRNPTGRIHRRGDPMAEGDFHIVVHVWMKNSRVEYLLTRRDFSKGFPGMWESTGGSALAGDSSLSAAVREVKEETGLDLDPTLGKCVLSYRLEDCFVDVWLFLQDFDLSNVVLLPGETIDKMYATAEEIRRMRDEGTFVPYSYLDEILEK